jgi:DNA repair exonuclease SbcCD ATPase subunit
MPTPEKPAKTSTILQFKKDLNQAGKVLQGVTDSLEKHASSLSEAEAALAKDRSLKGEIISLQGQITALREENEKIANARREEIASWADVSLKLTQEYEERLRKIESEYESKLKDLQKREEGKEVKWKQTIDLEKSETRRWRQAGSQGRQEIEIELRKAEESWRKKEEQFQTTLQQRGDQIVELSKRNKTLAQELTDHQTILRGRETQVQMLGDRLAALEAFPSQEVTETWVLLRCNLKPEF